jgi:hypothetical protein
MNKLQLLLGTILVLTARSFDLEGKAAEQRQWTGYLIDRQCAESVRHDSDPKDFVLHHTKDCALMPNCRAKGYALFADEKFFELDQQGNELAAKVLMASKKKRGFYARIAGEAQGKLLKVESITESEEPKPIKGAEKNKPGTN